MPSMNTHCIVGYLEVRQPKFLMSKLIELEANASTRRPHSHIHTHIYAQIHTQITGQSKEEFPAQILCLLCKRKFIQYSV